MERFEPTRAKVAPFIVVMLIICSVSSAALVMALSLTKSKPESLVVYAKGGGSKVVHLSGSQAIEVLKAVKECLDGIRRDLILKVIVTNERVELAKKRWGGVEVLFPVTVQYKVKELRRTVVFNRIFISFGGKFGGTVVLGTESGYSAYPPFGTVSCNADALLKRVRTW